MHCPKMLLLSFLPLLLYIAGTAVAQMSRFERTKTVVVTLLVECRLAEKLGNDDNRIKKLARLMFAKANEFYLDQINLKFAITEMIIGHRCSNIPRHWNNKDSSVDHRDRSMKKLRQNYENPEFQKMPKYRMPNLIHLLTGEPERNILGRATTAVNYCEYSQIFRSFSSVKINNKISTFYLTEAIHTLIHELGHTLGLNHIESIDESSPRGSTEIEKIMQKTPGKCAVMGRSSITRGALSTYTLTEKEKNRIVSTVLKNHSCLLEGHVEDILFSADREPRCGDGIVDTDAGEQCDAGVHCVNDACCDCTCKLKPQAQCASGQCCNNCRFSPANEICRTSKGPCAPQDAVCSGDSATCPSNALPDGTACTIDGKDHHCASGKCTSRRRECEERTDGSPLLDGDNIGICGNGCTLLCPLKATPNVCVAFPEGTNSFSGAVRNQQLPDGIKCGSNGRGHCKNGTCTQEGALKSALAMIFSIFCLVPLMRIVYIVYLRKQK